MAFDTLPPREVVERTIAGLTGRGVTVQSVETRQQAFETLQNQLPAGAEIMTGASLTLDQIGFLDLLRARNHSWRNLKDILLLEHDPEVQADLRRSTVLAQYWIGSVHAITEAGEVVTASATGSQLASYAFSSPNVIWVAGTQKIVESFDEAMRRIREYVFPLEDARMKSVGAPGSSLNKILIFNRESVPWRKVTMILVNEKLGF